MKGVFFFLGELNDQDIDWMIKHGCKRRLKPSDVLLKEGQPLNEIFLIVEGEFGLTVSQRGPADVAKMRPGEIVGEVSFIDNRPPVGSVLARAASVVLALPRAALASKIQEDLGFAARFYHAVAMMLAYRLRAQTLSGEDGSALDPETAGELEMNMLDNIHVAGARFQRILARLESA